MRLINIGIMVAPQITFELAGGYKCNGVPINDSEYLVAAGDGGVRFAGCSVERLVFSPTHAGCRFTLHNVIIGINFHWERAQKQTFEGELHFFIEEGKVRAVNSLPVENYLKSVISSEMSPTASLEFLKAHTVISRSWLYAQIMRSGASSQPVLGYSTDDETIRWYAREDHVTFDLCADDHCQRYQGVPSVGNSRADEAVRATSGIVLASGGKVCDARFSKCCGGMTERFSACWEDEDYTYLDAFRDNDGKQGFIDLTDEAAAREWIESAPDAFCNTADSAVLAQVLNGYDCETSDFYRWQLEYGQEELSRLVARRSGVDFGTIEALEPVERAASGRLVRLRIVGSKRTMVVGKELEIRRWLSPSHLYSSAFVVDKVEGECGNVEFIIKGAGWGHGVGLCQIGAAMMGEKGYGYKQILQHYYPGARLVDIDALVGE